MPAIRNLRISRFRGVPTQLSLDLCSRDNRPSSVVLIGDNGSGKSTIVDSLEFALQGRIRRARSLGSSTIPSAISFFDTNGCEVEVTLEPNEAVIRKIEVEPEGLEYNATPHPKFAISPLVLRRADILQFWDTPDARKQMLFFGYFDVGGPQPNHAYEVNDVTDAEEQLLTLKNHRRGYWNELAQTCGPESAAALASEPELEEWITTFVYKGISSRAREAWKRKTTPPRISPAAHKLVLKLRELTRQINAQKKEVRSLRNAHKAKFPAAKLVRTREGLELVSRYVTDAFRSLSPAADYVDTIRLQMGTISEISLTIELLLRNGVTTTPTRLFSEANLDLLALLIYFAIAQMTAENGQSKILVLDDVFQSIDGTTRIRLLEHLLQTMKGWQWILTVHDRLWSENVRTVFRRCNTSCLEKEIHRWSFQGGPEIRDAKSNPMKGLETALAGGENYQICAEAGRLLERASDHLSHALPVSVTRRKGDKYTLGDLWPAVHKAVKKTGAESEAAEVERWMHLRNLIGAHYNEWASSLSRVEAVAFGNGVLRFCDRIWCRDCEAWVDALRHGEGRVVEWRCKCDSRKLVPK